MINENNITCFPEGYQVGIAYIELYAVVFEICTALENNVTNIIQTLYLYQIS